MINTTVPVAPSINPLTTNTTTPTLTGTATLGAGESLSVTVNNVTYSTENGLTIDAGNWSLTIPDGNDLSDGSYEVLATVTDAAGNATSEGSTGELLIDTTLPALSSSNPAHEATNVATSNNLILTFGEQI